MPLSSQFRFQNAGGHSVWSAHLCVFKRRLEGPSARRVTFFDASARIKIARVRNGSAKLSGFP